MSKEGFLDLSDITSAAQLLDEDVPVPASKGGDEGEGDDAAAAKAAAEAKAAADAAAAAAPDEGEGEEEGEGAGGEGEEEEGEGSDEPTIIQELNTRLGFEVEGEFTEDYEGIANYTKQVGQKIADNALKDIFTALPDVEKYLDFRMNGGDPKQFMERMNFSVRDVVSQELAEDNDALSRQVVATYYQRMNFTEEEIQAELADLESSEKLYDKAKMFQPKLVQTIKAEEEALLNSQREEEAKTRERAALEATQIKELVSAGNVGGYIIPEAEKKEFLGYLADREQRSKKSEALSLESKIVMEYLVYKDFNVKGFMDRKAQSSKVNSLKDKLGSSPKKLSGQGSKRGNNLKDILAGGDFFS